MSSYILNTRPQYVGDNLSPYILKHAPSFGDNGSSYILINTPPSFGDSGSPDIFNTRSHLAITIHLPVHHISLTRPLFCRLRFIIYLKPRPLIWRFRYPLYLNSSWIRVILYLGSSYRSKSTEKTPAQPPCMPPHRKPLTAQTWLPVGERHEQELDAPGTTSSPKQLVVAWVRAFTRWPNWPHAWYGRVFICSACNRWRSALSPAPLSTFLKNCLVLHFGYVLLGLVLHAKCFDSPRA